MDYALPNLRGVDLDDGFSFIGDDSAAIPGASHPPGQNGATQQQPPPPSQQAYYYAQQQQQYLPTGRLAAEPPLPPPPMTLQQPMPIRPLPPQQTALPLPPSQHYGLNTDDSVNDAITGPLLMRPDAYAVGGDFTGASPFPPPQQPIQSIQQRRRDQVTEVGAPPPPPRYQTPSPRLSSLKQKEQQPQQSQAAPEQQQCDSRTPDWRPSSIAPCVKNTIMGIGYDLKHWNQITPKIAGGGGWMKKMEFVFARDDRPLYLAITLVGILLAVLLVRNVVALRRGSLQHPLAQPVCTTHTTHAVPAIVYTVPTTSVGAPM